METCPHCGSPFTEVSVVLTGDTKPRKAMVCACMSEKPFPDSVRFAPVKESRREFSDNPIIGGPDAKGFDASATLVNGGTFGVSK